MAAVVGAFAGAIVGPAVQGYLAIDALRVQAALERQSRIIDDRQNSSTNLRQLCGNGGMKASVLPIMGVAVAIVMNNISMHGNPMTVRYGCDLVNLDHW